MAPERNSNWLWTDPYFAWLQNYADLNTPVQSGNIVCQIYPGRMYSMWVSCGSWHSADVQFNVPAGYTMYLAPLNMPLSPHTSFNTPDYAGGTGTCLVNFYVMPSDGAAWLAPGYSTPPRLGDLTWGVSCGSLSNGLSAGALRWRSNGITQDLLDPFSLKYVGPNTDEITQAQYSDGAVQYIGTPQVQLYVRPNSNGYTIEVYEPYVSWTVNGDGSYSFSSPDYLEYTVSNPDSTWDGHVQIARLDRSSGNIDTWNLGPNSQGAMTIVQTNNLRVITTTSASGPGSGQRTETITVGVPGSNGLVDPASIVRTEQKVFTSYPWGEELTSDTMDPGGRNLTTTYDYYNTSWGDGHFSKLKSVTHPDGSWVLYDYYDDFARWGELASVSSPWQDGPSSPSAATASNCKVTTYNYANQIYTAYAGTPAATSVYQTLSAGGQTTINGIVTAKSTVSPSVWSLGGSYNTWRFGDAPMRTDTIQDYSSSGASQTTLRTVFNNTCDPTFASKLYSQVNPDGSKMSMAYVLGDFTNYLNTVPNTWDATSFSPDSNGTWWCDSTFYGANTQVSGAEATPLASWNGAPLDPIYLVPGKSTRKDLYIRNDSGLIDEATYVYTGSGTYKLVAWNQTNYSDGLWTAKIASDASVESRSYIDGHVNAESHADGTYTTYSFDSLMRVTQADHHGVGVHGSYPAQPDIYTSYTYNAAGDILSTTTQAAGGGPALTTSSAYDQAGLVTSHTDSTGLTTSFSYANGGRTVTSNLPNSSTKTTDKFLDGSPKSVTGNGALNQFYAATPNGDGTITATTYLGSSGSPRYAQTTTDWLGRTIAQTTPAFGGGTATAQSFYNAQGQLVKTTAPGKAPTLYQYNGLGQLEYSGLDVNNNGSLDLGSMDRVTQVESQVVQSGGVWWQQTLTYVYNQNNNGTPLLQSEKDVRLVPYAGSYFGGGNVFDETQTYDTFRNLTDVTTSIDRANALTTTTTHLPDSSTPDVVVSYNGLEVSHQSPQAITTTYQYDGLGRQTAVVNPRIGSTQTAYYSSGTGQNGQIQSTTDPAGNSTTYAYDSTDGRLFSTTDPSGNPTYHAYDYLGREVRTWGPAAYPSEVTYDSYGEKVAMRTFRDTSIGFGSSGWPLSDDGDPQNPNPSNWSSGDKTSWAYDAGTGLLTSKTDASGRAVSYSYNSNNQMTSRTWARDVVTSYSYDPNTGEETGISYSDGTPSLTYSYNRLGQTSTVTDVTGTRTFTYYQTGSTATELQSESLPGYLGSRVLTRTYDTSTTGAIGRATGYQLGTSGSPSSDEGISYGYDSYGRLNGVAVSGGPSFTYSFLANSDLLAGVADSADNFTQTRTWLSNRDLLSSITTSFGSTAIGSYAYQSDSLGRRTSKVETGSLYSRYQAGGLAENFGYDPRSEVTSDATYQSTNPSNTSTPVLGRNYGFSYDPIGNRITSSLDGTQTSYSNNALNELTQKTVPGYWPVSGFAPNAATLTINGSALSSGQKQGDYYEANVSASNGSAPAWEQLTVQSSLGGSMTRNAFLPQAPEPFSYDADGNLLTDGRWHYDWDAENRMIAMETIGARSGDPAGVWNSGVARQRITFAYDYLGRRVDKTLFSWNGSGWSAVSTSGETRFIYDGWNVIADYDSTGGSFGARLRSYAWGLDLSWSLQGGGGVGGLLAEVSASGVVNLAVQDGNGNVTGLVDRSSGAINAAYEYSPFGETIRSVGLYAQQNPFRFSSKYTDDETQMLYFGCRYYDPSNGRFLGRDPTGEQGGLNLFAYVRNNPVNSWDYLGQAATGDVYSTDKWGNGWAYFTGTPDPSWALYSAGGSLWKDTKNDIFYTQVASLEEDDSSSNDGVFNGAGVTSLGGGNGYVASGAADDPWIQGTTEGTAVDGGLSAKVTCKN